MAPTSLDLDTLRKVLRAKRYRISFHARLRLNERRLNTADVQQVIFTDQILEQHPNARPYPKCLMMAVIQGAPLYVSIAYDRKKDYIHIITVHGFDPTKWRDPWTRKRKP